MAKRKIRVPVPGVAELLRPAVPQLATSDERPATGRERHDQKITVYLSAAELLDLEHARLRLRRIRFSQDETRDHGHVVGQGDTSQDPASQNNASQDKDEDAVPSLAWVQLR